MNSRRSRAAYFPELSILNHIPRWQLKDAVFPPKRSLVLNKLNVAFIESRRARLEVWWQAVLEVDRIAEFTKHHASQPLKVELGGWRCACVWRRFSPSIFFRSNHKYDGILLRQRR